MMCQRAVLAAKRSIKNPDRSNITIVGGNSGIGCRNSNWYTPLPSENINFEPSGAIAADGPELKNCS